MTTTAKVFGTPDQEKEVQVEFEHYPVKKFFGVNSFYIINFCEVKTPLEFKPSDLKLDLEISIAEHLGVEPNDVRIDCEIAVKTLTPVLV